MTDFIRARKPEHKAERRNAVLEAAARMTLEQDPALLSLSELARQSGVSKPNVYRYFESREEILLRLFVDDLSSFVNEVEGVLESRSTLEQVSSVLTQAYARRPRLCQFLGMVSATLERNVSEGVIAEFKREILRLSQRLSAALHAALPQIVPERLAWAASMLALFVAGLWPAAHPAPPAAHVLEQAEFKTLRPHFERDLNAVVMALLGGLGMHSSESEPHGKLEP